MEDKKDYNRKNVDNIKKGIVFFLAVICALPVLLCLYLTFRVNTLEGKFEGLSDKISETASAAADVTEEETETDLSELDRQAYDDIGTSTTSESQTLMLDDNDDDGDDGNTQDFAGNGKKVYLTFDDGPSIYTDEILDILKDKNVKATFFCVYTDNENLWPCYSRIADEGHTLGMHSYSHVYDTVYASEESFIEDVTMIHDFLYEQTGVDCKYYRFPGGSSNTVSAVDIQTLMGYLYSEGITYYDWNSLSGDAVDSSLTAEQLNENIMGYVRANEGDSVVLMHDLKNAHATVEALPALIDTLKSEGYEICAIDESTEPVQHVRYKGTEISKEE